MIGIYDGMVDINVMDGLAVRLPLNLEFPCFG